VKEMAINQDKSDAKPDVIRFSEIKRRVLEGYLRGEFGKNAPERSLISCRPPGEPVPLSFAQQQVWLHGQMAGDIRFYNEAITVYRQGALDVAVLERCLHEIIRRHEIWRTTFDTVDGEPTQVVHPAPHTFPLSVADLRKLPEADREAEAQRLATENARLAFDLKRGPLLRALLVRTDDEQHRLYMTLHQIIFDAVTAYRVFVPELAMLYEAFSAGKPSPLPKLRIQYADFAYWQRKTLPPEIWSKHLVYWRRQLAGELPLLQWPNDRPRPPIETHRGAIQRFTLPKTLVRPLRTLGQQEGVSLYMILLAAFVSLLHRYTRQDDIIVGSLTAGRKEAELEQLLGYFVNPLALRIDLSGNPTFRELLSRVRGVVLDALAHEDVPFPRLVQEIEQKTDPSRNPLFQIILSQQPQLPNIFPGWDLATEEVSNGGSKLDLIVVVDDRGDGISGPITYNPDLFDGSTITRVIGHWQTLLAGVSADAGEHITDLPILTDAEREQLLVEWNTPAKAPSSRYLPLDGGATLHELFEAQVVRRPEAVALTCEGQVLTYGELNAQANRLARQLTTVGVKANTLVGLCMDRSNALVIAILAILKAGGAYLPIDLSYPAERLAFMLEDARAPVLLTHSNLSGNLPHMQVKVLCVDELLAQPAKKGEETNLPPASDPDDLAYVVYTSGTTGKPKGSLITHRNVARLFPATEHWYGFNEHHVWTLFHSFAFDFSVWEIWGALLYGGRLVVVPFMVSRSPEAFYELLIREQVTVLNQTPSAFRQLVQAEELVGQKELALRYVIFGGEALEMQSLRPWFERHGDQKPRLVNMYGITETTVHVTYRPLSKDDLGSGSVIGVPIPDLQIYILDEQRQPVPVGVPGEMYVGGAGLARGYLRRPELTVERFIPDHFTGRPGSRLYKTGDLARFLPGRDIEYLGRIDDQVKIRGFRMELGEIEAVLRQHRAVKESVIVAREDVPGDKRLVAYFVRAQEPAPTVGELRDFLKKKLPEYMVPSVFVTLTAMPLTPNGKVNRRALPAPEQPNLAPKENFAAPRDVLESQLVKIWESVLNVRPIGVRHNFFEVGGHSLVAVRLMHRVEQAFGKNLPIATLLQAPTIEQLAAILRQKGWSPPWSCLVPIQTGGSKPPFFCVHGIGGAVVRFYDLARHLGADQPFYGLQAYGLDARHSCHTRAEDMAAHYIKEIRSVQPEGPYFLGGYSFGGIVAFEIAQQLTAQDQEEALVLLFDTICTPLPRTHICADVASTSSALLRLFRISASERRTYLSRIAKASTRRIHGWLHVARLPRSIKKVRRACLQAARDYTPRVYSGRVILFRSSYRPLMQFRDSRAGWSTYAAHGLEIHEIEGDHENFFLEPQVRFVAEQLKACLDGAQAASHAGQLMNLSRSRPSQRYRI
jgi:amino acid adenylation domain-containing protein